MSNKEGVNGYNVGNLNIVHDVDWDQVGGTKAIRLPALTGNSMFHVKSTTLQLLQLKGLLIGLADEDPHEYICNIVDIYSPLNFRGETQEAI